jgi:DNA-binding SARP family transcriptional activator
MPCLEITTLGAFQTKLEGQSLAAFHTDKARALLVILAVEAARPHRRETLACMFWPERPAVVARNNLRQALYRLRNALGEPASGSQFLRITPKEIQFDPGSDYWLDVKQFSNHLAAYSDHHAGGLAICEHCLIELRAAVALYGGDFLSGFSLPGCPQFDWWLLGRQEFYHRQVLEALACLGGYYESSQDYHQAATVAQKKIELEPWRETAHRRLMRALALGGNPGAALRQYETCRRILMAEMGIEPSTRTKKLFEQIRLGSMPGQDEGEDERELVRPPTAPGYGP